MPTRTWRGSTNSNWGTATNWLEGAVPTNADDVVFDASSPNCTVNVAAVALTITFATYINTITFNNTLSISGNITLGSSMTFAGTSTFRYVGTSNSTFTSNGKEVGVPFTFNPSVTHTITFADDWTFGEDVELQTNGTPFMVYNGSNLFFKKSLLTNNTSSRPVTGTIKLNLIGSGVFGANTSSLMAFVGLNTDINTSGSYLIKNLRFGTGGGKTFNYYSGTITAEPNSTLFLTSDPSSTLTLNLNGIDFENITETNSELGTFTLVSDLKCKTFTYGSKITINGNTFYITSLSSTSNYVDGTTVIYFNGWAGVGSFNVLDIRSSIIIDTPNTLIIGNVGLSNGGSINHIQGNINHTGTLTLQTCSINFLPNVVLNTIVRSLTNSIATYNSNITCRSFQNGNVNSNITNNGGIIYILESFTSSITTGIFAGTTKFVLTDNCVVSMNANLGSTNGINNEIEINSNQVVTISGNYVFGSTSIFRHLKGTVISKGSTLLFRSGATLLNMSDCPLDNVQIQGGGTISMDEFFCGTPQIPTKVRSTTTTANYTINFTDGFEKLAKFVNVSNCTIGRRGQLLILTKNPIASTNLGVRSINAFPNGLGKRVTFTDNMLDSVPTLRKVDMLVGDPVYL